MKLPLWAVGLAVTTGIQMAGSFMSQSLPVVAPLLTAGIGVGREQIGVIYALNMAGSILFLAFGTPLIVRLGPLRAMRLGVFCGACALALVAIGQWPVVVVAALLMGLSYGPAPTGSTRILAATALPKHRALIFSVKQAGAQLGGVLAGLTIAPVAAHFGWATGLALPIVVGMMTALLVAPARRALEIARDPPRPVTLAALFSARNIRAPFAAVAAVPSLMAMTILTTSLAVVQGCLFSFCVTYLVTTNGMSLTQAGIAYACMQGGGMIGRVIVGWTADRSQNVPRDLLFQGWASAGLVLIWAFLPPGLGLPVIGPLGLLIGLAAASWPGLILSEVSRLAPDGRIADAASGSSMITFVGYVAGPVLFSIAVRVSGGWLVPYLLVAGQIALMAAARTFWPPGRREPGTPAAGRGLASPSNRRDGR